MNEQKPKEAPSEILIAEFEYLAEAAKQASEEHARVPEYFFMALGSSVAYFFSFKGNPFREIPFSNLQFAYGVLILILLILAVFGFFTIRRLISLRIAWLENTLAMAKIKEYYIDKFQNSDFSSAFRFRADKLPNAYKIGSISHFWAVATSLVDSLLFVFALAFGELYFLGCLKFAHVVFIGFPLVTLLSFSQERYYRFKLKGSKVQEELEKIRDEVEAKKKNAILSDQHLL